MKPDILVGTADGLHQVGDERSSALDGREVTALSRGESGWWALLDGSEAWRSGGDGKWSRLATLDGLKANCIVRSGQKVLVGTSEAHLYALKGEDLEPVEAFDNAPGRAAWHTPWGGPPDVRSLSADPDGKVYANVHVGGIARSSDGGGSWEPTIEISADVHEVLFDAGSGLLLAAWARGLSVSSDDGATWTLEGEGLHGRYLRSVAVANETVLVGASTGPYTERAAIYRKPLKSSGPFQRCNGELPEWFSDNVDTSCLAASGPWVAAGSSDGVVYLSPDEGESWDLVADGLPSVRCVELAR